MSAWDWIASGVKAIAAPALTAAAALKNIGLRPIRGFIDSHFRPKVIPEPGSVLYCDLYYFAEHSGIYGENGKIVNLAVNEFANAVVQYETPRTFTDSSASDKIYVSCRGSRAVGDDTVAWAAEQQLGQEQFYGLVFKNCHEFSSRCVRSVGKEESWLGDFLAQFNPLHLFDLTWEPTILQLKRDAKTHLGANKWLLWDWKGTGEKDPEPDWNANEAFFKNQPLTPEFIQTLQQELAACRDYEAEIADEDIPEPIRKRLVAFGDVLQDVHAVYEKNKNFLKLCSDAGLTYNDLKQSGWDFQALAQTLQNNPSIQKLVRQMGRAYIDQEAKKRQRVPRIAKNEVHGVEHSDDLMRMLPAELVNVDDEDLQTLFYARLLEHNLLTYKLHGIDQQNEEHKETQQQRTGPVVACLDTSGSMDGAPLQKARALLLAVTNILKQEKRSLHVLIFGDSGQKNEYTLTDAQGIGGLIRFLSQGFGGGTDFDAPLKRALEIVRQEKNYLKADILMISDGDCALSDDFAAALPMQKDQLNCRVYSVLCNGKRTNDNFSDEVMVL